MSSAMVLIEVDGLFLTVSRKDDFNDFGLPGGKVDPGESFMQCAIRETLEETGLHVSITGVTPFELCNSGYRIVTYAATVIGGTLGNVGTKETGIIKFNTMETILEGSFKDYNIKMFKHFNITH